MTHVIKYASKITLCNYIENIKFSNFKLGVFKNTSLLIRVKSFLKKTYCIF